MDIEPPTPAPTSAQQPITDEIRGQLQRAKYNVAKKKGVLETDLLDTDEEVLVAATQLATLTQTLQSTQGVLTADQAEEFDLPEPADSDVEIDEPDETGTYQRIWSEECVKVGKTLADYPFIKHPKSLPRAMDEEQKENTYRMAARYAFADYDSNDINKTSPFTAQDPEGIRDVRTQPASMAWVMQSRVVNMDTMRTNLLKDNEELIRAGASQSLVHFATNRNKKGKQKTTDGDDLAKKFNITRKQVEKWQEPTDFTDEVYEYIVGRCTKGLEFVPAFNQPSPFHPIQNLNNVQMIAFVKNLLYIQSLTKDYDKQGNEIHEQRTLQPKGAMEVYKWMVGIMGAAGRRRLISLAQETDEGTPSMQYAVETAKRKIKTGGLSKEFKEMTTAWSTMTQNSNMSQGVNRTVSMDLIHHTEAVKWYVEFDKIKMHITTAGEQPPTQALSDSLKRQIAEIQATYGSTKTGVGRKTLLIKWMANFTGLSPAILRVQLHEARILHEMSTTFGQGILCFVPTYYASRFRNIPTNCRIPLFELFNKTWQMDRICRLAWEGIGQAVIGSTASSCPNYDFNKHKGLLFLLDTT